MRVCFRRLAGESRPGTKSLTAWWTLEFTLQVSRHAMRVAQEVKAGGWQKGRGGSGKGSLWQFLGKLRKGKAGPREELRMWESCCPLWLSVFNSFLLCPAGSRPRSAERPWARDTSMYSTPPRRAPDWLTPPMSTQIIVSSLWERICKMGIFHCIPFSGHRGTNWQDCQGEGILFFRKGLPDLGQAGPPASPAKAWTLPQLSSLGEELGRSIAGQQEPGASMDASVTGEGHQGRRGDRAGHPGME